MKYKIIKILILFSLSGCTVQKPTIQSKPQAFGVVVSVDKYATEVGEKILQDGGNAIDAAVGIGFALAVTYPRAGNLGGGGFMVLRLKDGRKTTIDYREKAPLKSSRDMYLDSGGNHITQLSEEGYLSVGVPGSVAGMLYALENYGSMSIEKVLTPSFDLAMDGFKVDSNFAASLYEKIDMFRKYTATAEIFLKDSVSTYKEGDIFKQPDLAGTIDRIIKRGNAGFYDGLTAEYFVSTMKKYGGIISKDDLLSYNPIERKPLIGNYRGYDIISMPPPSSGGVVMIEMLNILEEFELHSITPLTGAYIKLYVEASKYAFADRAEQLGDTDFYPVPVNALISKEYAKTIVDKIRSNSITPSNKILDQNNAWLDSVETLMKNESDETTHYSVMDKWGNVASVTTTLNSYYGSKVVVEGAGFLLNNEMDDFSAKVGSPNMYGLIHSEANAIEPNKRMLSSMTPTIIEKDGEIVLITGSPGGSRIISAVTQTILYYIDFGMEPGVAVKQPRVHHQWLPDTLYYESGALATPLIVDLEKMGYNLKMRKAIGNTHVIGRSHSSGNMIPIPDMRRGGHGAIVID